MRDRAFDAVRRFLSGELTIEGVNEQYSANKPELDMWYEPDAKITIVWCLALASPSTFGLRYYNGKLIGDLDDAWRMVFPDEWCLATHSWRRRLHGPTLDEHGRKTRHLTPSPELIDEIVKHIGDPSGGIARYFSERNLPVPTKLDPRALQTVANKSPAPAVVRSAERLAQELRETHTPSVIAHLRRIL